VSYGNTVSHILSEFVAYGTTGGIKQTGTHNRPENGSDARVALCAHPIHTHCFNILDKNLVSFLSLQTAVSSNPTIILFYLHGLILWKIHIY
jgi:hypothetical protein